MRKTSILIAESHRLLRQGLAALIASDPRFMVVGETGCGAQAAALATSLQPDVVLLDINLPLLRGVEALQRIRQVAPHTRVLTLALHTQWGLASSLLQEGALGYITRNTPRTELITALQQVALGSRYLCRDVELRLNNKTSTQARAYTTLTPREWEVITYVCRGASSREIASNLQLSQKTVETHRYHILKKLCFNCTTALIDWVHQQGWLQAPMPRTTKGELRGAAQRLALFLSPGLWEGWLSNF